MKTNKGKGNRLFGTMKADTSNMKTKGTGKNPIVQPKQQKRIGKK